MLPSNRLSVTPVTDNFFTPFRPNLLTDYEWGGVDLRDNSQGLQSHLWTATYNEATGVIQVSNGINTHDILTVANVQELSLAFDLNMNVSIAYKTQNNAYLYWFDTIANSNQTLDIGTGIINPMVSLDDRRLRQSGNSDIVFSYVRGGKLYVRYQRHRYQNEYELGDFYGMLQTGMMTNYRFGFMAVELIKYW